MNYFEHHIGDYAAATAHLSLIEDAIYSRLLRRYYLQEEALPADVKQVARLAGARSQEELEAVQAVLDEFFTLTDTGWHNKRADEEIARYQAKIEAARENGRRGGRPPKNQQVQEKEPKETQPFSLGSFSETEPKALHTPDTNLQEEQQEQQHVQPLAARCRFGEFWAAYPNKKGKQEAEKTWKRRKLDGRCDELIDHVRLMEAHDDGWRRGYVPMGSTYLNQARWEDVPQESARAGPQTGQIGQQLGKTAQGLMALKEFANGGLDQTGNFGGPDAAHVLGPGADAGGGGYPADRRRLAGGHH
ncbi:TPA: YdaU family protein [Stenotrophomonas maltophilia]|uniref:YdaU family protein n=1 Tax=Stenotrophomonas maltophilia TaxID=40324 RepID=UPI001C65CFBE|nr:YdaU family protein [Stenotrophomonas maltophilia]